MDAISLLAEETSLPDGTHAIWLDGVCSVNGGPDVACRAVELSITNLTIETEAPVRFMDAIILQLPHIGILEAVVAERFAGGFVLKFERAPESKLGTYLSWLESSEADDDAGSHDGREWERLVPIKRLTTLKRGAAAPTIARIIDLSRSGAAFTTSARMSIGDHVRLGALRGRLVRLFEGGAAVKFHELIDAAEFNVLIDLDAATSIPRTA